MNHDEWATQVIVAPSGSEFISAGIDGRIVFWDLATGKLLRELRLPAGILTLNLSNDGKKLAAGDVAGNVSIADVAEAKPKLSFRADKNLVNAVAWSKDGSFIAAGGSEGIVRLASVIDGKVTAEINPSQGDIVGLAFAGDKLVVGLRGRSGSDRTAEVWNWRDRKLITTFDEGPSGLRTIAVSPDARLLAIGEYIAPTLLTMLPNGDKGAEVSLRVLPYSDEPAAVGIWDIDTGKRLTLLNAETGAHALAFSPDGKFLATAGPNGTMLHDVGSRTFAEVGRIDSQMSIDAATFSPDSRKLILAREREPLVRSGPGGTDKLVDPIFTSAVMQIRQGLNTGVMASLGANMREPLPKKPGTSLTGGSAIEVWDLNHKNSAPENKLWEAIRAFFNDKPDESQQLIQQVLKDFPTHGEARRLDAVLFGRGEVTKVRSALDAAVKADPKCVSCWRSLGDLQYQAKQYSDAIASYDRVLQLNPEYGLVAGRQADAYGALGVAHMSLGNTEETMDSAKQALRKAIDLRPGVEQFYTNLGAAYYFRGDIDTNIELLLIARRLRPDRARIYYNLGHAYRFKGDRQNAIAAYRQYVGMGEPGEEARVQRAKDFIKELSK